MDESNLNRLYELAKAKRRPVGTMAREWIVEKLDSESGPLDMGSAANLKKALEQIMISLDEETKRRA